VTIELGIYQLLKQKAVIFMVNNNLYQT